MMGMRRRGSNEDKPASERTEARDVGKGGDDTDHVVRQSLSGARDQDPLLSLLQAVLHATAQWSKENGYASVPPALLLRQALELVNQVGEATGRDRSHGS